MSITKKIALIILSNTAANVVILFLLIVPTIRESYTEQNNDSLRYGVRSLAYSMENYLRRKRAILFEIIDKIEDEAFENNIIDINPYEGDEYTVFELGTTAKGGSAVTLPTLVNIKSDRIFINGIEVEEFFNDVEIIEDIEEVGGTLIVYSFREGKMIPSYISSKHDTYINPIVKDDRYFNNTKIHEVITPFIAATDPATVGLRRNEDIVQRFHFSKRRVYWYIATTLQNNNDEMIGALAIMVPELNLISDIRETVDSIRFGGDNGYAYILDHNGYFVYHPREDSGENHWDPAPGDFSNRSKKLATIVQDIYKYRNGYYKYIWDHPNDPENYTYEKILYSQSIESWKWIICIAPYKVEFIERINKTFNRITVTMILSGILIVIIFFPVSRRLITDRIVRINNSLKRFSEGNFDHAPVDSGGDEIGSLSQSFYKMGVSILKNVENLNDMVQQRTADLSKQTEMVVSIFDNTPVGIAVVNNEARIKRINRMGLILADAREKESKDILFTDLFKPSDSGIMQNLADAIQRGNTLSIDTAEYMRRDSSLCKMRIKVAQLDSDHAIILYQDITEEQRLYSYLVALMDFFPQGAYIVDRDLKIQICTAKFAESYGNTSKWSNILNKNILELIGENYPPQVVGRLQNELNEAIETKSVVSRLWNTRDISPNNPSWYHSLRCPIFNDAGEVSHLLVLSTDVTELKETQEKAEEGARIKSDFLANMSHEIRTPLNAVIGFSYLALAKEMDEGIHDYFDKIHTAATNLLQIINDILDFSKIEAGKLPIENVDFNLSKICKDLKNIMSVKSEEKGIDFIVDLSPEIPLDLNGDPLRLTQILLNLCNNAVKFTDNGFVKLSVIQESYNSDTEDNIKLTFQVKDSGIGMSQEQQMGLFHPFVQADSSTTREYGGTGLGLSICKRLVSLMNGEIAVESAPNVGSVFTFVIPFKLRNTMELINEFEGKQALIGDKDRNNLHLFDKHLSTMGFKTTLASSFAEVFDSLNKAKEERVTPYDIILMDEQILKSDYREAIRKFTREIEIPLPPTIMITPHHGSAIHSELRGAGVERLLSRPYSFTDLRDALSDTLGITISVPPKKHSEPVDNHDFSSIAGTRILLAEDNEINQIVVEEMLANTGVLLTCASNGKEALSILSKEKFDLFFVDIQMPLLDGHETSRTIRKEGNTAIPIIAMTAHALEEERQKCLESGMNDLITKPIDPEILYSKLLYYLAPDKMKKTDASPLPVEQGGIDTVLLNIEEGVARLKGNKRKYFSTLKKFINDYSNIEGKINECEKEYEALLFLIHTIKGVSGNLGAHKLHNNSVNLEEIMKAQKDNFATEGIPGNEFDLFITSVNDLCNYAEKILAEETSIEQINNNKLSGNTREFQELIQKAKEAIEKRNARDGINVATSLNAKKWPDVSSEKISRLIDNLEEYRFTEAKEIIDILKEQIR